jgi:hypothetical protein
MSQGDVPVPTVVAMIAFVRAVPATEPILDQHRATNRAIVPQLLMADLRHFVVSVVACNERVLVADLLAEIERLASSDDHSVRELVQTGFIRALVRGSPQERDAIDAIRDLVGPATSEALRVIEHEIVVAGELPRLSVRRRA